MNVQRYDSANENVWKYVFLFDKKKAVAEAVLYRYPTFKDRTVICCSTQSGCPIGCRFCGAGDYFVRSLTGNEIVAQVKHAVQDFNIDADRVKRFQIMFMSMGEPLLNKQGLTSALKQLHALYPHAALLISTSAPNVDYEWLYNLSCEIPTIGLQFSVHESTDDVRDNLIPFKHKLTLKELAAIGDRWANITHRRPFFNYCAHEMNTSYDDVDRLYALFNPTLWECTVSVICERDESIAAANERQRQLANDFMSKMLNRGYNVRMFDPAGQDDIGGGCGQLWFVQDWMKKHPKYARKSAGADECVVHTPRIRQITKDTNE